MSFKHLSSNNASDAFHAPRNIILMTVWGNSAFLRMQKSRSRRMIFFSQIPRQSKLTKAATWKRPAASKRIIVPENAAPYGGSSKRMLCLRADPNNNFRATPFMLERLMDSAASAGAGLLPLSLQVGVGEKGPRHTTCLTLFVPINHKS